MKKTNRFTAFLKTAIVIAIALTIGFGATACGGGSGGGSLNAFIGTWVNDDGNYQYIITSKDITFTDFKRDGSVYGKNTVSIDSVTPLTDDYFFSDEFLEKYPIGMKFDGKYTSVEGNFSSEVGSEEYYVIWMSKGKKEIVISPDGSNIFKKK